jgi:hypothetical protein
LKCGWSVVSIPCVNFSAVAQSWGWVAGQRVEPLRYGEMMCNVEQTLHIAHF